MQSCKKTKTQSVDFVYCCCCWAVIVRYVVGPSLFTDSILVSKTVFKNVCVAGMAVRLNMSLALLCSHINKSTHNDSKPKKHAALKNPPLRISDCTFSFTPAGGDPVGSSISDDADRLSHRRCMDALHQHLLGCKGSDGCRMFTVI